MNLLRPSTAHSELLQSATGGRLTEQDALLWMVLLHTHQIHIVPEAVEVRWSKHEQRGMVVLAPHTQRGVACAIASIWAKLKQKRNKSQDERCHYIYWYWQYNTRVPYEISEDIPEQLRPRLEELRAMLTQDPRVLAVIPEE
jgi:hypothetical protein